MTCRNGPKCSPALLSALGLCALFGGWLGGELVERLGVGVDEGANLDAAKFVDDLDPRNA